MNSVRSNSLDMKFTPSDCEVIGIRKFEFAAKTQFLYASFSVLFDPLNLMNSDYFTLLDFILKIFPYLCFLQMCKPDKEELIKQLIQPIANMDSYGSHIYKTNHFDGLNKNKIKKLYSGTHKNVKKEDDMMQKSTVYFMFDSNSRLPSQQFYRSQCRQIL